MSTVRNKAFLPLCACLAALLLCACAGPGRYEGLDLRGNPVLSDPENERTPPPLRLAEYGGAQTQVTENGGVPCELDWTNAAGGYVAARALAPGRNAYLYIYYENEQTPLYTYPLRTDGAYDFYPLSRGSGLYRFQLWVEDPQSGLYGTYLEHSERLSVQDEFSAFLVPNKLVSYSAESALVAHSYALLAHCSSDLEVVQVVYRWICDNISYDHDKAANSELLKAQHYIPDPDQVLASRTGICYDYAALAAAMLRANGVPTRLVMGDASNGEGGTVYHAWNEVYLEEEGWVAVKISVDAYGYTRVDATFAAGSDPAAIGAFISDDGNYSAIYYH